MSETIKKAQKQELAKIRAQQIWNAAKPASINHPYLLKKQIKPYDIKQNNDDLVIPLRNQAGEIQSLQFIAADGTKRFLAGGAVVGNYHQFGERTEEFIIGEGYATIATAHEASSYCAIVAFDAGNLLPVARNIRQQHPRATITICADNDQWGERNTGIEAGTKAAQVIGAKLVYPKFDLEKYKNYQPKPPTDLNDLHVLERIDAVRQQLASAAYVATIQAVVKNEDCQIAYKRLSEINAKSINWLWRKHIACGKGTLIVGDPGLGKSQLTISIASTVTIGGEWPDKTRCEKGNVISLSAEDAAEDTLRPRFEAAGADLSKVFIVEMVKDGNKNRTFNLKIDLDRLEGMVKKIGGVRLLMIDPLTAYLGDTDSHRNSDVRALLAPLAEFAAKHEIAVLCVSHLNKSDSNDPLMRVTGSLAFVAAARAAFIVLRDPQDKDMRLFLPIKNNIGDDKKGFAFKIETYQLSDNIETSRTVWGDKTEVSAPDVMKMLQQNEKREPSVLDDAIEFLKGLLANGEMPAKQIKDDAKEAGYSWSTVIRAKKKLFVEATKKGMNGGWIWALPPKEFKVFSGSPTTNVIPLGTFGENGRQSGSHEDDQDKSLSIFEGDRTIEDNHKNKNLITFSESSYQRVIDGIRPSEDDQKKQVGGINSVEQ